MAAQLATQHDRRDTPRRTYWDLLDGWYANESRDNLTPSTQLVFGALLHLANRRFFPATLDVNKKALADLARVSVDSVRRALDQIADAELVHLAVIPGRGRIRVGICYGALEGQGDVRQQVARVSGTVRPQVAAKMKASNSSPRQSHSRSQAYRPAPSITRNEETPDCPVGQLRVPEVGGELRDGDLCPKCQTHALRIRFKTDTTSRTKQRFLACPGHSTGACRGFTWNLGSTAYKPSQRVLSQALSGARHVPGRPALVRDMFAAAERIEEPAPTTEPTSLAEWFAKSGYLPADLMLETLAEFAPELAAHHRTQGSDKTAILRAVKARISEGSK